MTLRIAVLCFVGVWLCEPGLGREQEEVILDSDSRRLFSGDGKSAFEEGAASELVTRRNGQLGNLLNAERGVYYAQILYGLLRFRRAHELQPLHDDLYAAVRPAQEALADGAVYDGDRFREDLAALKEWKLIREDVELQRLRGYRDSRRRKFRYSLSDESVSFLEWLEERLQDDLEERGSDTRDLLEAVCGSLRELSRVLHRARTRSAEEGDARRVLFQLGRLDQLTHAISGELLALNARMYGFVVARYTIAEARQILRELEGLSEAFLRQTHALRGEIVQMLGGVHGEGSLAKIRACVEEMEAERRQAPHMIRRIHDPASLLDIPSTLAEFYREDGTLDTLCRRISATTTSVWRKLHLHLRELERKNHRLEDLRARIGEIAALSPDEAPGEFLFDLIAPAQLRTDAQYWDEHEKAMPPEPRREVARQGERVRVAMPPKTRHDGPVRTMEERRLELLRLWLEEKLITPAEANALIRETRLGGFDDLARVMELVKVGKLGRGRKLSLIGYLLSESAGRDDLAADGFRLSLPALRISRGGKHE